MAYKRGQEVFCDPNPFSYVVDPKYRKIVCDCCLKMSNSQEFLKACAKCNWVYYCDQTCQKEAWKSHHKLECKYLLKENMSKNLKEMFNGDFHDSQLLFLKLLKTILKLNKLKEKGKKESFQLPNGKKRCFDDLVSNADELRKQKEQMNDPNKLNFKDFHLIYKDFKIWLGDAIPIPSFTGFFEIYAKWHTNSTTTGSVKADCIFSICYHP